MHLILVQLLSTHFIFISLYLLYKLYYRTYRSIILFHSIVYYYYCMLYSIDLNIVSPPSYLYISQKSFLIWHILNEGAEFNLIQAPILNRV